MRLADVSCSPCVVFIHFFFFKVNSSPTRFRKSEDWGEEKISQILASLEKLADLATLGLIPVCKLLAGGNEQLLPQSPLLPIASPKEANASRRVKNGR